MASATKELNFKFNFNFKRWQIVTCGYDTGQHSFGSSEVGVGMKIFFFMFFVFMIYFFHFYQFGFMDSYSLVYGLLLLLFILMLRWPSEVFFKVSSVLLSCPHHSFWIISVLLILELCVSGWHTCPAQTPRVMHFSKEPWFFLEDDAVWTTKSWCLLGVPTAIGVLLLVSPLSYLHILISVITLESTGVDGTGALLLLVRCWPLPIFLPLDLTDKM